jgi:hypothetical protein
MDSQTLLSWPSLIAGFVLSVAAGASAILIQSMVDARSVRPRRLEAERFEGVKQVREVVHRLKECHWKATGDTNEEPWLECCSALNDVRESWNIFKPVMDPQTVSAVGPLIELAKSIHADGSEKNQIRAFSENARAEDLILTSRTRLDAEYARLCGVRKTDTKPFGDIDTT